MKYNETEMLDYISKTAHKMNVENNYNYGVGSEPGGEIENSLLDLDKWEILDNSPYNQLSFYNPLDEDDESNKFFEDEDSDYYSFIEEENVQRDKFNDNCFVLQFYHEEFCEGLTCWVIVNENREEVLGLFWESS